MGPRFAATRPYETAQGNALGSMVKKSLALKGRNNRWAAASGLDEMLTHTQGVALGYRMTPRCG